MNENSAASTLRRHENTTADRRGGVERLPPPWRIHARPRSRAVEAAGRLIAISSAQEQDRRDAKEFSLDLASDHRRATQPGRRREGGRARAQTRPISDEGSLHTDELLSGDETRDRTTNGASRATFVMDVPGVQTPSPTPP
jgi:hypothetical protein